jgi:hypothetical protein
MIVLVWAVAAGAQETERPAVLEVLAQEASDACPDVAGGPVPSVVRTNQGLARLQDDGTYGFGCPDGVGGDPAAPAASAPDGRALVVLAPDGVRYSETGGCTSVQVEVDPGELGRAVTYWRDAFWVVTDHVEGAGASLYRVADGAAVRISTWEDFRPDGLVGEDAGYLWLAGASPTPGVRRLSLNGGLSGDAPLSGLPPDTDVQALVPVAANEGEAWLRVERRSSEGLILATVAQDAVSFRDPGDRPRNVLGPVWDGAQWLAVMDAKLRYTLPGAGTWSDTGQDAPWTCLQALGDTVFACTVPAVLRLQRLTDDLKPKTREVFSLAQIGPSPCGDAACDAAFEDGLLAAGYGTELPVVCPDGRTADDLLAPASCGCAASGEAGGAVGGGALGLLGAWLGARRRARVAPRPRCGVAGDV